MKRLLQNLSRYHDFDGWAVQVKGAEEPLRWTFSTTRQEAREVRATMAPDLFQRTEVVKAKIHIVRSDQ